MAEGHGWGGASRAGSNHPALASASAAPPYPRRGALSRTYVAVYSQGLPPLISHGIFGSHGERCVRAVGFLQTTPRFAQRGYPGGFTRRTKLSERRA